MIFFFWSEKKKKDQNQLCFTCQSKRNRNSLAYSARGLKRVFLTIDHKLLAGFTSTLSWHKFWQTTRWWVDVLDLFAAIYPKITEDFPETVAKLSCKSKYLKVSLIPRELCYHMTCTPGSRSVSDNWVTTFMLNMQLPVIDCNVQWLLKKRWPLI